MTARILNGIAIRDQIYARTQAGNCCSERAGIRPGLAAVLVGENAASQIYVRSKIAACEQLGLGSWLHHAVRDRRQPKKCSRWSRN